MEQSLAGLTIDDDEDTGISIKASPTVQDQSFKNCLVGTFHTSSVIHFLSMRATLANVWHPLMGISISDLGRGRYLFRLYHEIDVERILNGGPWNFNGHLLILHKILPNEDPRLVPLNHVDYWIHILDLPVGFFSEPVARQIGDFLGKFISYDSKALLMGFKQSMRIRVQIDVRKPFKRRKKLMLSRGNHSYVRFEYEKLTVFCFICGLLGHGESYCPTRTEAPNQDIPFGWDNSIRAPVRKKVVPTSRWLKDEEEQLEQNFSPTIKTPSITPTISAHPIQSNPLIPSAEIGEKPSEVMCNKSDIGTSNHTLDDTPKPNNQTISMRAPSTTRMLSNIEPMREMEEDSPLHHVDGQKRQRIITSPTEFSQEMDYSVEHSGYNYIHNTSISAGLNEKASRAP